MEIEGHSVFGYFNDINDAQKAEKQLREAGFDDTQLDAIGNDTAIDTISNPLTGNIKSLAHLTLGTDVDHGDDRGILRAADPSASGLAGKGLGDEGKAWLVVTVTDGQPEQIDRAVEILESCGGEV